MHEQSPYSSGNGRLDFSIVVKLIGLAATGADHHNAPIAVGTLGTDIRTFVLPGNPNMVDGMEVDTKADAPHDAVRVFDYPDSVTGTRFTEPTITPTRPLHWSRAQ
jgi:hypothetical protein